MRMVAAMTMRNMGGSPFTSAVKASHPVIRALSEESAAHCSAKSILSDRIWLSSIYVALQKRRMSLSYAPPPSRNRSLRRQPSILAAANKEKGCPDFHRSDFGLAKGSLRLSER